MGIRQYLRHLGQYFNLMADREDETEVVSQVSAGVMFRGTNLWILICAIFIASLGLNVNSTAVIIGAMLISPLMGPLIGMGLSVLIILTCCNVVVAALRKIIPEEIRLAIFVVVIAGFVTIVDLLLQAFIPALSESLGVFIPLIVVNCIIIGRAEAFCQKNTVKDSFFDGIFQGLGYTCVLIIMCVFRELVGSGRFGGGLIDVTNGFRFTLDGTGGGIRAVAMATPGMTCPLLLVVRASTPAAPPKKAISTS